MTTADCEAKMDPFHNSGVHWLCCRLTPKQLLKSFKNKQTFTLVEFHVVCIQLRWHDHFHAVWMSIFIFETLSDTIMHIPPVFSSHHLNPLTRTSRPSTKTRSKIDSIQILANALLGNQYGSIQYTWHIFCSLSFGNISPPSIPVQHQDDMRFFQSTRYPKLNILYLTIIFPKHGIPDAKKTDIPLCQSTIFKPTSTLTPPVDSCILRASLTGCQ